MAETIIFDIDSLVASNAEEVMYRAVIPTILVLTKKVGYAKLKDELLKIIKSDDKIAQRIPPEALAMRLGIDYNALLDIYSIVTEAFSYRRPQAQEVLKKLKSLNKKIIVYTYSDATWARLKLAAAGLDKFVDFIVPVPLEDLVENATIYTVMDQLIKKNFIQNEDSAIIITTDLRDYIVGKELGFKIYLLSYLESITIPDLIPDLQSILDLV